MPTRSFGLCSLMIAQLVARPIVDHAIHNVTSEHRSAPFALSADQLENRFMKVARLLCSVNIEATSGQLHDGHANTAVITFLGRARVNPTSLRNSASSLVSCCPVVSCHSTGLAIPRDTRRPAPDFGFMLR